MIWTLANNDFEYPDCSPVFDMANATNVPKRCVAYHRDGGKMLPQACREDYPIACKQTAGGRYYSWCDTFIDSSH